MPTNDTQADPADEQLSADASINAFTSALLFNALVGLGVFVVFCIVRQWNKKIYQPRTYLVPEDVRSPELPAGIFSWITFSFKVKDNELLDKVGLDAYMFLRFLRMSAILFTGFTLCAIPILFPLNAVKGLGAKGLTELTMGNVAQGWRLWFHLSLTIAFCGGTVYMLWKEMQEYTRRRHAYLMSEKHAKTPQSTTILVTAIPPGLNSEDALYNIFNRFPGGVKKIWLNRQPKKIVELCKEREEVVVKLEMAELQYIRSAYEKPSKKDLGVVKEPVRPLGRTSRIPFKGKKVDLVEFYTDKLCELNSIIGEAQQSGTVDSLSSAFIQFNNQFAAHSAVQTVVHPTPFRMAPMYSEISPLDVVWDNMNLNAYLRKGRHFISLVAASALILLWTTPVLFVSTIANISDLVKAFPFLAFMEDLPEQWFGIIQGILPPLFMAILMAILPVILTAMATFEGHVRYSSITLSVMSKYFFFLVVNVLLISTLSGGFIKTFGKYFENGFAFNDIIKEISVKLPGASVFFVNYTLLKGFTGPALELLQITPLVLNFLFTHLLAKSPRQIWNVQGRLNSVNYGVLFPPQTLIFCIGMLYSTIAPLVLPFVAFYFTMHYFVYRHQFLYVYHQPIETGGLAFPKAVKQVYTGIFISEITLFGIYLLKQAELKAVPQMVLLLITTVVTAYSLKSMKEAFNPLVTFLPVALFSKDLHMDHDGVVTDGPEKVASTSRADPEAAIGDDGSVITLENLSGRHLTSHHPAPDKEGYLGTALPLKAASISSKLPAFPTPRAEVDSLSFTKQSHHPYETLTDPAGEIISHYSSPQSATPLQLHQRHNATPPSRQYLQPSPGRMDRPVSFTDRPASFADRPGSMMDRPASFLTSGQGNGGLGPWPDAEPVDAELERMQDQAYCHPAIYNVQTPVWLPQDERGLVQTEMERLSRLGITVATDGAGLSATTAKTHVEGIIYAPGEESRYRLERGE